MSNSDFDPFAELQLSPDAEPELVKAAFKALAKKYHPDRFSDPVKKAEAESKMARINEAQQLIQSGNFRPSFRPEPTPSYQTEEVPFRQTDSTSVGSVRETPKERKIAPKEKPALPLIGILVGGILFASILGLPSLLPGNHLEKALEYENKGEYTLSLEQLNRAVAKDPHNRKLYGHRARIWEKLGKPEQAAVDLKNAEIPTLNLPMEASASPEPTSLSSPEPKESNSPAHPKQ